MLVEARQKRPSTLLDIILKHFNHANLYTPRRTTFSHLVNTQVINPLKPELNPICYLLALLGVHSFLHVSRIRVKLLTVR